VSSRQSSRRDGFLNIDYFPATPSRRLN
jgi:hypothetical protein